MGVLKNDSFLFSQLGIPFITNEAVYFTNRLDFEPGLRTSRDEDIMNNRVVYTIHKSLNGTGPEVDQSLYDRLQTILRLHTTDKPLYVVSNPFSKKQRNVIPVEPYIISSIKKIYKDLLDGQITVNGMTITIKDYELNGEYFILYKENGSVQRYSNVKGYYSITSGQYVLFFSNGFITSFDNIAKVEMSKDVRITDEDLNKIWRK